MKKIWIVLSALIVTWSNSSALAQCSKKRPYRPYRAEQHTKTHSENRKTTNSDYEYEHRGPQTTKYEFDESLLTIKFNRQKDTVTETRSESRVYMSKDSVSVYHQSESRTDKVSKNYNAMNMITHDDAGNTQVIIRKR